MKVTPDKVFSEAECAKFVKTLYKERERALSLLKVSYPTPTILCRIILNSFMFELMLNTGLRISETVSLEFEDIHDDYLIVRAEVSKNGERGIVYYGEKTAKLIGELKAYLAKYRKTESKLVFTLSGKKLSRTWANLGFKYFLKQGNLPERFSPHNLRHTYATNLLNHGMTLPFVRDNLRHSSIDITSKYLHVTKESRQKIKEIY